MINQGSKVRPDIINLNSNEPVFYPFSIKTCKCSGSCNNISDPYAKICVSDAVKNLNVKVFQELMKQDTQNGMKRVSVNKDQMQVFVTINNVGMMINAGANANNLLIKDLFGILVIVSVSVINRVMQVNTQTMKTVSAKKKKNDQLKNVLKLLKKLNQLK